MEGFEMKIATNRLKLLCCIINLVAKVGKDLVIEVDGDEQTVYFRALNDAKSAFVSVEFVGSFFSSMRMPTGTFSCKIPAKPICSILGNLKNVEFIKLKTEHNETTNYLIFQLLLTNRISKTYRFCYQDCEIVNAVFDEDSSHVIQAVPKLFSRILSHLYKAPELVIATNPTVFSVSSFYSAKGTDAKQHLSSGLNINVQEFDYFNFRRTPDALTQDDFVELILCSKELRAMLGFCEAAELSTFTMLFSSGGRPVKLRCEHPGFRVAMVLATLESEVAPGSVARRLSQTAPAMQAPKNEANLNIHDQPQLEEEQTQVNSNHQFQRQFSHDIGGDDDDDY